jgi:mono/diheme cytochrome c family protein
MRTLMLAISILLVIAVAADAQDTTWRKDIQPIVQAQCGACHGPEAPVYEDWEHDRDKWTKQNVGPRMDTYAYFMRHVVWPATGSLMRRLDDGKAGPGGKPGNMYDFLGGTDQERAKNLQTIKTWLGEGAWNLNRWQARGNVPGITKEQLDKIKAKY